MTTCDCCKEYANEAPWVFPFCTCRCHNKDPYSLNTEQERAAPAGPRDGLPDLTDEEFMTRLRARFVEVAGEGADEVADNADTVDWRDGFENDPEGAADSEMSYWDNDGE